MPSATHTFALLALLTFALRAQVAPNPNLSATLDAFDARTAKVPGNTPSQLIPLTVDPPSAGGEEFIHIVSSNPNAKLSLVLPNAIEVNAANAAANGFTFTVASEAEAQAIDSPSALSLIGTHTLIEIAPTAPGGVYNVKIDTIGIAVPTDIAVLYFSSSQIRLGGLTSGAVYALGQQAVLSAVLADGTTAVTGAAITASVQASRDVSPQVTIGNYQLISQTPGGNGIIEYTYSARATNSGAALTGVQARGVYSGGPFHAGSTVTFGPVAANGTATGLNTFTVALPAANPFNASSLSWSVTALSPPVSVIMADAGPNDAQSGDGIYTGLFSPSLAGTHMVTLTATGIWNGAAFSRMGSFQFDVIATAGSIGAFTGQGLDRNGNATGSSPNFDALEVTANTTVPQAGSYRFSVDLRNASAGVTGDDAKPVHASADLTLTAAGSAQFKVVFPAEPKLTSASVLTLSDARIDLVDSRGFETSLVAFNAAPGNVPAIPAARWERRFEIPATGHSASLIDLSPAVAGADVLRVRVVLPFGWQGPCGYSGTLTTASGQLIQNTGGRYSNAGQSVSWVEFDFGASYIVQTGIAGPYKLSFALISCGGYTSQRYDVYQTPAYTLSQFTQPGGAPSFTAGVSRPSLTIAPTGSGIFDVEMKPMDGFNGMITPSITGLPAGVQLQFMPLAPWPLGRFSVSLRATNVAAGNYPLTLNFASGSVARTSNITLVVSTTIPVTITTSPLGRTTIVDSIAAAGDRTFSWNAGDSHTLSVPSPQVDAAGVTWVFDRWSDSGGAARTVVPRASMDLKATMVQEWTQSVLVTAAVPVFDTNLRLWIKPVSIKNNGTVPLPGPIYMALTSRTPDTASLRNLESIAVAGLSVIQTGSSGIQPGATINGSIFYTVEDPDPPQFTFTPRVFARVAPNVTAQTTISLGTPTIDPVTTRIKQTMQIWSNAESIPAAAFVFDNLPPGISLYQPSGVTSLESPAGSLYRELGTIDTGVLTPTTLEFTNSGTATLTYTARILGGGAR